MDNGNIHKALNHAILLHLAKYSKVCFREIPALLDLIEYNDFGRLSTELTKIFSVSKSEVLKTKAKFQKLFQKYRNGYKILFIKDNAYPKLLQQTAEPPFSYFAEVILIF